MPQNSLHNITRKNDQQSGSLEYLKAEKKGNQDMSKLQFHIKIPQTCPLCHLHRPLKAPLICPHLRARLRIKYALEKTRATSTPPLNRPQCCPTFPGCICKPKARRPVHFSSLKIFPIPKRHTTTSAPTPRVIKSAWKKMEVTATQMRHPTSLAATLDTLVSPGLKQSKGIAALTSQGTITSFTRPSMCTLDSWRGNLQSGGLMEEQGRSRSTQNPLSLKSPISPLVPSSMTQICDASTSTSTLPGGTCERSKSWATLESSPMCIDSNDAPSKSGSWSNTRGCWTDREPSSIGSMPTTSSSAMQTPRKPRKQEGVSKRRRCALGPPPSSTRVSIWGRDRTGPMTPSRRALPLHAATSILPSEERTHPRWAQHEESLEGLERIELTQMKGQPRRRWIGGAQARPQKRKE